MELAELLAALAKLDKEAVIKGLQTHAQGIFQAVFDLGHGQATATNKPRLDEATGRVTTLTAELEAAKKQIVTLSASNPDVAKLQGQITELEGKVREAEEKGRQAVDNERLETGVKDFERHMIAAGVDPDYAALQATKPEVRSRIRVSKDGKIEILRKGMQDVPITAGDKTPMQAFVEELIPSVPPKMLTSDVDRGSGIEVGGSTGGKSYLAKLKTDLTAQRKTEGAAPGLSAVQQRMGMAPKPVPQ